MRAEDHLALRRAGIIAVRLSPADRAKLRAMAIADGVTVEEAAAWLLVVVLNGAAAARPTSAGEAGDGRGPICVASPAQRRGSTVHTRSDSGVSAKPDLTSDTRHLTPDSPTPDSRSPARSASASPRRVHPRPSVQDPAAGRSGETASPSDSSRRQKDGEAEPVPTVSGLTGPEVERLRDLCRRGLGITQIAPLMGGKPYAVLQRGIEALGLSRHSRLGQEESA